MNNNLTPCLSTCKFTFDIYYVNFGVHFVKKITHYRQNEGETLWQIKASRWN